MKKILQNTVSKMDGGIGVLGLSIRLTKVVGIAMLAALIPILVSIAPISFLWGVLAWAVWSMFVRILWVRNGLDGLIFGRANGPQKNDVHSEAEFLSALKAPFTVTPVEAAVSVFVGRTPGGKSLVPVHFPPEVIRKNHISIMGASGTGKSKLAAWVLSQMHQEGDAVVVFDPKDDEFLAGILSDQAKLSGRPFTYINLRSSEAQINPFKAATPGQIEQLLQAGLNLDPSGNPSVDFYRGEDREAVNCLVQQGDTNILEMLVTGATLKEVNSRQNFWREFRELARLEAFHTNAGPDLDITVQAGGIVYVVGDTDDLKIVAAQKLLLARVLQIIKGRPRSNARQVSLFLDEFKYMLSNSALRALGTIRDRRCNLILAYQSFGDLEDCGTLPAQAVLGAAKGNTTIKFVYKLEEAKTAEELSKIAGDESYIAETTSKVLQDGLEGGQWKEESRRAVSVASLTTAMPKPLSGEASLCWVFGLGPVFPLATMHMQAGTPPTVVSAPRLPEVLDEIVDAQTAIGLDPVQKTLSHLPPDFLEMPDKQMVPSTNNLDAQDLI